MLPRRLSVRRLTLSFAPVTGVAIAGSPAAASDLTVSKGFRKAVTVAGIRQHQAAFQGFSDANGGNRVAGSPGYVASQEYVVDRMEAAGDDVSLHEFQFLFNTDRTPPIFRQESPEPSRTSTVWTSRR